MAIAGGATTAYRLWIDADNQLRSERTSTLRDLCATPAEAAHELRNGRTVIVAGSDVDTLRSLLSKEIAQ